MTDQTVQTSVLIETSRHQIFGNVAIPALDRLSDYANDPERHFWAITEAEVAPIEDPERMRSVGFILVARHEIATVQPGWRAQPKDADGFNPFSSALQPPA